MDGKESWGDFMDRAKRNGLSPSTQEAVDRESRERPEFKGWDFCYYCGEKMTDSDIDFWDPKMCCSGHQCGCMGKPTEPPCCISCGES